ncbi:hypothetical protein HOT49_gp289 [Erwinia phage vB_EamM_Alexandra]|uniref:Uncharacterized protein n=1 Tax=Erwinia phage vB_EamM_Alexandra TaxID=2201424 RepID=A0A2Z4QE78_9CAUD|nr:hypothetical protein HOT49_gp289 [Erwinia phage vB_EamM_Alexandra]AWY08548.1 hypothetical protein Alexandra_292 [Erwinia phage vB_EamM_Alexandra]
MNSIIKFLMDEDEVQDALTAYRTDPTDENKRRVIETLLREGNHAQATMQLTDGLVEAPAKQPHRFVLIPSVDSLKSLVAVPAGKRSYGWEPRPDDMMLAVAKQASAVADHVHKLGGSAAYVRFTATEWHTALGDTGLNRLLREMKIVLLETESLDAIADSMAKLIRIVGNMTDMAYSIRLIRQMYAVAENRHDATVTKALIAMVDTTMTQNMPIVDKENADD